MFIHEHDKVMYYLQAGVSFQAANELTGLYFKEDKTEVLRKYCTTAVCVKTGRVLIEVK